MNVRLLREIPLNELSALDLNSELSAIAADFTPTRDEVRAYLFFDDNGNAYNALYDISDSRLGAEFGAYSEWVDCNTDPNDLNGIEDAIMVAWFEEFGDYVNLI